ncbi:unnamed protein product [Fusarium graminearum]|uniref:Uncharacterized protein n=1 Tax=Gibberella zeae TaxID=5518 RepID=A0A8H3PYC6_GIBZA|nr:unnamed protein product [Fusarium graminearum]CAG1995310.1 unnamed protein product [Fusarium graminearum]
MSRGLPSAHYDTEPAKGTLPGLRFVTNRHYSPSLTNINSYFGPSTRMILLGESLTCSKTARVSDSHAHYMGRPLPSQAIGGGLALLHSLGGPEATTSVIDVRDSLVVTDPTTNPPVRGLTMGERIVGHSASNASILAPRAPEGNPWAPVVCTGLLLEGDRDESIAVSTDIALAAPEKKEITKGLARRSYWTKNCESPQPV